jgi:hypothetical protein
VETWHGFPNAYTVAQQLIRRGYHGCWVLALGTNDAADVAVGSTVSLATRIRRMMSLIGGQLVMWVNVTSLLASGPYSQANMQAWNRALLRACPALPEHAGLRLGRRSEEELVHPRRHSLHPTGIRRTLGCDR